MKSSAAGLSVRSGLLFSAGLLASGRSATQVLLAVLPVVVARGAFVRLVADRNQLVRALPERGVGTYPFNHGCEATESLRHRHSFHEAVRHARSRGSF